VELLLAAHPYVTGRGFSLEPTPDDCGSGWGLTAVPNPPMLRLPFQPGQSLLGVTDGVTDFGIIDQNAFGMKGLRAAHEEFTGTSAGELCDHVLYATLRHGRLLAASKDDLTVLALHWECGPG
jgi:hypothetical protein